MLDVLAGETEMSSGRMCANRLRRTFTLLKASVGGVSDADGGFNGHATSASETPPTTIRPMFSTQLRTFYVVAVMLAALSCSATPAVAQRALGLDISAWQGNISQATWNNIRNVENRSFVFIRSSRGGTTGFYNQSNPDNDDPPGQNTLSQRYDDPYFVQNITRATTAGMFAGSYHFSRPDIVAGTLNSGGLQNNGTDEANHFIQMAGAWMRPGYLLPVHDFEAGDGIRTDNEMAQFAIDFSNRIYEVMGIRPAIYVNGNYSHNILGGASAALRQPSSCRASDAVDCSLAKPGGP